MTFREAVDYWNERRLSTDWTAHDAEMLSAVIQKVADLDGILEELCPWGRP